MNSWSKEQKASFLAAGLVGQAKELLQGVSLKSIIAYSMFLRCLRERCDPGDHSNFHRSTFRARKQQEREGPIELGQAIRTLTRKAYYNMTAIELEFLAKDHFIDALTDEETRRYVTLDKTKTFDEAIGLALEYEAMTKVEEFRKRRAIRTISSDAKNEVKENRVNFLQTKEDISLNTEISKIVKQLGQTMTTMEAIVAGIQNESKPQLLEQRYNGFRNRHWNNNAPNNVQKNNRRGVYWICVLPENYSRDCPQTNHENDQRNSCKGQTASELLSP